MAAGFAFVLLAQATSAASPADAPRPVYGPAAPAPPKPIAIPVKTAERECPPADPDPKTRVIVVCAQRPQGYRLNPDVMRAKREVRSGGRPTRPGPIAMKDNSCASVGPAGCFNAGINLIAAAVTAATMAARLAKGEEIGSMFITDPHPDEYHLYLAAKREREAREAEKAAAAKAKTAAAAKAAGQAESAPQPAQ